MPKVRINDSKGLIQEAGSGLDVETTMTVNHDIRYASTTLTANTTLKRGGLFLLSSSDTGLTITLPLASNVPGAMFIFRGVSSGSHIITASQEARDYRGLVGPSSGSSTSLTGSGLTNSHPLSGNKLTFPGVYGVTGSSVTLLCDGYSFLSLVSSGTMAIGGI